MGRILLRILKWLAITVAVLLLVVLATGGWLLGTESGRQWAATTGLEQAQKAGLDITLEGLETPEFGHWSADYFAFRQDGVTVAEVRDFALIFQPRALLDKTLQVDSLRAASIAVNTPPASEEPPPEEEQKQGGLPDWKVNVDALAIDRFTLTLPEPPAGQPIPAISINGWLKAFGELPLLADFTIEGLDDSDLAIQLDSKAVSQNQLALTGSINESAGGFIPSLLQLPAQQALAAQFDLALQQREGGLDIQIEELTVPLADHQLGAAGTLLVDFEPQVFTAKPLVLITDGARHTLNARYSEAGAEFDLALEQLPLSLAKPWVEPLEGGALSGRVKGNWDPNSAGPLPSATVDLKADARAYGKNLTAAIQARTAGNLVELAPSKLTLDGAELTAQGPLELEGDGTRLSLELRDFSTDLLQGLPVTLPPDLAARSKLTTALVTGSIKDPHVQLETSAEGSYQQQPLSLAVDASASRTSATVDELVIKSASLQARAEGVVDWTADGSDFTLAIAKLDQGVLAFAPADVQAKLPPGLAFDARGELALAGALKSPRVEADLKVGGRYEVEGEPMPFAITLLGQSSGGDLANLQAEIQALTIELFDEPALAVNGTYERGTMDITLDMERLPVKALAAVGGPDIGGEANAKMRVTGTMEAPAVAGNFRYADEVFVQQKGRRVAQPVALTGQLDSRPDNLKLLLNFTENERPAGELTLQLPLDRYLTALKNKTDLPLAADAAGQFKLSALQLFIQDPTTILTGDFKLDLQLSGSPATPQIDGNLALQQGRFANPVLGVDLREIELALVGNGQTMSLQNGILRTKDDGRVELQGAVNWGAEGRNRDDAIQLTARLRDAKLLDRRDVETSVAGELAVAGSFETLTVNGDLLLAPLEINLDNAMRTSIPQIDVVEVGEDEAGAESGASAMPVVNLNIGIRTGNPAYLRGLGIETELEGEVRLRGTATEPQYTGEFRTRRGELDALTKTFNISDGSIVFSNQVIGLNIPAVLEQDGYTFKLEVLGTAEEPRFEFSSVPSLPKDEILSRLLFGESVQNLSPFDAIALANAMRNLGSGGQGIAGKARNFLGVDDVELDANLENPGIGVGKYLSENVYFQIERNLNDQNPFQASIQYELTPSLTLEGGTGETGAGQGGIKWKRDY